MNKIHRCPKCAQPKFKRKAGRGLEEESVADAEGEKVATKVAAAGVSRLARYVSYV